MDDDRTRSGAWTGAVADEGQGGLAQAARVEAYEEDWYRSLKALAERRRDLFGADEEEPEAFDETAAEGPEADAHGPEAPAAGARVDEEEIQAPEEPSPEIGVVRELITDPPREDRSDAVGVHRPEPALPLEEEPAEAVDGEPAEAGAGGSAPPSGEGLARPVDAPAGPDAVDEAGALAASLDPDASGSRSGRSALGELETGTESVSADPESTSIVDESSSPPFIAPVPTFSDHRSDIDASAAPETHDVLPPLEPAIEEPIARAEVAEPDGHGPVDRNPEAIGAGTPLPAGLVPGAPEAPSIANREPNPSAVPAVEEPGVEAGGVEAGGIEAGGIEEPQVEQGPSLLSRDPQERRRALIDLSTREPSDTELEQICGLLMDPDREVRLLAVQTLAGFPERVEDDAVRRAVQDPDDEIRAAAVRLAAHRSPCDVSLLAPLLSARRHPRTQRTVMEILPAVIASSAPEDEDVAAVVRAVGEMDPGPQEDEHDRLADLAHALGRDRLTGALGLSDAERLGAVRLLADGSSPAVLRALAALVADPIEEVRTRAQRAAEELSRATAPTAGADGSGRDVSPIEPVETVAARLADLDLVERERAAEELARRDRDDVLSWVLESLTSGTTHDAEIGALAAARLELHEAAPALLSRTTGVPSQERRLLLESLQAVRADPGLLVASLDPIEPARRPQAVDLLWELYGADLIPFVGTLLSDASPSVRVAALEGIGNTGDAQGAEVAELILTSDPAPSVRAAAVRALGRCVQGSPGTAMERALADPDPDVRATALQSLPVVAEDRLADLVSRSLSDPDDRVRRAAMQRFAEVAGGDRGSAWAALRSCPPAERGDMVAALEQTDAGLIELAFERLRSPEEDERVLAVEIVGWGGSPGCVEAGIQALADPSAPVRRAAVASLGRLRDPSAAGALNKALVDPDPDVRIGAVNALGVIDDESVLGSLVTALKDPEPRVRRAASQVLTEWSSPAVARRLAGVLAVPSLRDSAADLLTRIGPASVELLIDVLRQGNPALSPIVGGLLSRIVGVEDLLSRFSSPDPQRRLRAVEAVGAVGGQPGVDALIRTLFDPDEQIRIRSAQLLGALGDRRAEQPVRQAALEDPVPEVVQAANEALARLGAEDGGQAA